MENMLQIFRAEKTAKVQTTRTFLGILPGRYAGYYQGQVQ